ncbi:M23 family metallopeptidase [Mucilaginibacter corticis]|uniref:M23 family metallopeptidase n=1 Tax=Mucilaginibacter corticis TaxID=2597670 RepID=A0A556MX68_9SPHI|nr:M23 family metallopeptidase [Mucilaginibacter corticis]TSJ44399.1 M23 family metallopeptidase [Mucilaginibacter corticis]
MNRVIWLAVCCLPLHHLTLTSGYGYRLHPVTGKIRYHDGIDLRAHRDTIFAVMPGRIAAVEYDHLTGVHIRLRSGEFAFLYGHLSQVFVLPGDSVEAATPLGLTGSSGRVTGEHLHFSVSFRQVPVNPLLFLRGLMNNQLTN